MSKKACVGIVAAISTGFFGWSCGFFQSEVPVFYRDSLYLNYPLRILISTSLQSGQIPLWDHWTHAGLPLTTLFSNLNFSPIVYLLSIFGVYGLKTLAIEALIYNLIGFFGMFTWLKTRVSLNSSLLGAFCFCNAVIIFQQTSINFEALPTYMLVPWLSYGLNQAFQKNPKGIGIICLSLIFMFTAGYLGSNIILVQLVFLFSLCESLLNQNLSLKNLKPLWFVAAGFLLTLLFFNLSFFESWDHFQFNFSDLRDYKFDPFEVSSRGDSFLTLLFPNEIFPYRGDKAGYPVVLYCGNLMVFFFILGFNQFWKHKEISYLGLFLILSYGVTLSAESFLGSFFTSIIPFFDKVRFHGWLLILFLFYFLAIACFGLNKYWNDPNSKREKVALGFFLVFNTVLLVLMAVFQPAWQSYRLDYVVYPQVGIIVLFLINHFYFQKKFKSKSYSFWSILILILLDLYLIHPDIARLGASGLEISRAKELEKNKTKGFPAPPLQRIQTLEQLNPQYYSKIPNATGYFPLKHPKVFNLKNKANLDTLFKGKDISTKLKILKFTPNQITIGAKILKDETLTWSSPYTSSWKVTSAEKPLIVKENPNGLTDIHIPKGEYTIEFKYQPSLLRIKKLVTLLSFLVALFLALKKRTMVV